MATAWTLRFTAGMPVKNAATTQKLENEMSRVITQDVAHASIRSFRTFTASALSGMSGERSSFDPELMDEAEWLTLRCYRNAGDVDYIVLSYNTPIAYHTKSDGWIECKKKHSATTSRHQGIVRRAIHV